MTRYEKLPSTIRGPRYSIIGYCTVYRYYLHTPTKASTKDDQATIESKILGNAVNAYTLPCRVRISQFLILPPYQHRGHGSLFYEALFTHFLNDEMVKEVTVEDPNESFDDLRDFTDLARLRRHREFAKLKINIYVMLDSDLLPTAQLLPLDKLERMRLRFKIAERQFIRLVEMQLLSRVPSRILQASAAQRQRLGLNVRKGQAEEGHGHDHERFYMLWRLFVKQRLLKRNKLDLIQHDWDERADLLEEVMEGQEKDYVRLIQVAARNQGPEGADAGLTPTNMTSTTSSSRGSPPPSSVLKSATRERAADARKISTSAVTTDSLARTSSNPSASTPAPASASISTPLPASAPNSVPIKTPAKAPPPMSTSNPASASALAPASVPKSDGKHGEVIQGKKRRSEPDGEEEEDDDDDDDVEMINEADRGRKRKESGKERGRGGENGSVKSSATPLTQPPTATSTSTKSKDGQDGGASRGQTHPHPAKKVKM